MQSCVSFRNYSNKKLFGWTFVIVYMEPGKMCWLVDFVTFASTDQPEFLHLWPHPPVTSQCTAVHLMHRCAAGMFRVFVKFDSWQSLFCWISGDRKLKLTTCCSTSSYSDSRMTDHAAAALSFGPASCHMTQTDSHWAAPDSFKKNS